MKKPTRLFAALLALCLATAAVPAASAAEHANCAAALYELGLFRGVGELPDGSPDFALDGTTTREAALVMLIRLLGEEEEARAFTGSHPFADVPNGHWAGPYIAYGYAKGYTTGISETLFGLGGEASANMYLTFVLRALGYDDRAGDFSYAQAHVTAKEMGLTGRESFDGGGAILRDSCAYVSYLALFQPLKGGGQTLAESLYARGVIPAADLPPEEELAYPSSAPGTADPTPAQSTQPVLAGAEVVHVSTVEELAAAAASNTEIHLAPGVYHLDWDSGYYMDLRNFALVADGEVKLLMSDGDDTVLYFSNCENLVLSGLTLGHDVPFDGGCSAGVLLLSDCTNAQVLSCDIYGCGVTGICALGGDFTARDTTIRECSCNAADLYDVSATFSNCVFRGNGYVPSGASAFILSDAAVALDGCTFTDNKNQSLHNLESEWSGESAWVETHCDHTGNGWQ